MKSLVTAPKSVWLIVVCVCLFAAQSAQATIKNRNDIFKVLENIDSDLALPSLDIWVNEKTYEPAVNIGDTVYFSIDSATPAFYTLIHVDSKGSTSILLPMSRSISGQVIAEDYVVFPSLTDECAVYMPQPNCFDRQNQLVQVGPIGQDTVFLLASNQPISSKLLGMGVNDDFKELGKDVAAIEALVKRINSQSLNNPLSVVRYSYSVESEQTQYTTRAIKRKVRKLAKIAVSAEPEMDGVSDEAPSSMNFNNINFAFNSAALTVPGKVELDGLGSVLVGMQAETGAFPLLQLTGHTDSTGPAAYNMTLSARRAESAKRYLAQEHGVPLDQVLTVGAGESMPLQSNASGAGRALNRRVELKVVAAL